MKRIKSKLSEAKKRKRNNLIIGVILIFVMFGSIFGIIINSFGSSDISNEVEYNGFTFINNNGYWGLEIGDYSFIFRNNPYDVENIETFVNYLSTYNGKPLYISSYSTEATSEIISNIGFVTLRVQNACLEGRECEGNDYPVKTCADNFIIIEEKNESGIMQDNNCVFIQGSAENIAKISDEFLFHVLGVR